MTTYKLITSAEELQYMSHFVDDSDPTAARLCGVHFAPGGDLVATDGRVLCRMVQAWEYENTAERGEYPHDATSDSAPADTPPAIPAEGLTLELTKDTIKQLKALPVGPAVVSIDYDPERVAACVARITGQNGMSICTRLVDDTYPEYMRIFPTDAPAGSLLRFNPALLDKFTGWSKLAKKKGRDHIQLTSYGDTVPMGVRVSSNPRVYGLLMPVAASTFDKCGEA